MPSLTGPHRRDVLRLIAGGAAAALAGCSKPDQPIFPRAWDDEGGDPGTLRRYATALPLAGIWRGVTGLVVDGRPIKIEGNDAHPASLGATDLFAEAAILDLYDPQRLRSPAGPNGTAGLPLLEAALIRSLAGSDGAGLRLLTGRVTSPTLLARIAAMRARFPAMRHVRYEAINDDHEAGGAALAFGRVLTPRPRLDEADAIVALDADPLGPGPDQIAWARAWATRRLKPGGPQRLHVLEPSMTQTGACADRRTAVHPNAVGDALLVIARVLGAAVPEPTLPQAVAMAAQAAVRDLLTHPGRAMVLVGRAQPAPVHALAHWINARLQAPVGWIEPVDPERAPHAASLTGLVEEMGAGKVSTLVMIDVDPLNDAPAALGFAEGMKRVGLSVAAAAFPSATTQAAHWAVPLSHPLESWGDGRGPDGTAAIVQPLVRPLYRTRSALEVLGLVDPRGDTLDAHAQVQRQWADHAGSDGTRWWRDTLVAGVVAGSASPPLTAPDPMLVPYPPGRAAVALTLQLAPSATLWDGRLATNAWAQECPDPLTKEVWGASLRLHPDDAARLKVADGDLVVLGAAGEASARIVPGQARGVATLPLGGGRTGCGAIAEGPGANGFAVRGEDGGWHFDASACRPTGARRPVTSSQHQFALDGDLARLFPVVAPGEPLPRPPHRATLLPRPQPAANAPPQWAMVIDTAVCIGCNACVVACQAENNVPAIGPEEMARGRDMHWLRVDRYDRGKLDADPRPGFQPVPCMHCETAPCEPVCPVEASVHDEHGLNLQVYNRCVGTRTCQANCPYKVRRFNFLDYAGADLWDVVDRASVTAQRNPDVTVRARGVMEKCTYCIQRIEGAEQAAHADSRPLDPSIVRTACEAACPTRAIRFGTGDEPEIATLKTDPRHYGLLEELGTRPRTTYLAKLGDPGPAA